MTNTHTNNKRIAHTMTLLTLVGVASSFVFALTVAAAGFAPTEVIVLANSARTKAGLSTLTENTKLAQAAKNKANDMIKNDYFAHTSPKGVEPWYWIKDAGYQYQAAGENLAINYTDAREQHTAWMKSESHRANILNTRYREIGVAVMTGNIDGKESIVTVEYFAAPLALVADERVPVPPALAPAEIKGMETLGERAAPTVVAPVLPASRAFVPVMSQEVSPEGNTWLIIVALVWLSLSMLFIPLVFLFQVVWVWRQKKREEEVSVPVVSPLNIDSIHQKIAAH